MNLMSRSLKAASRAREVSGEGGTGLGAAVTQHFGHDAHCPAGRLHFSRL
jgi:hypothetical protein